MPSAEHAHGSSDVVSATNLVRVGRHNMLGVLLARGMFHSSRWVQIELDAPELTLGERDQWRARIEAHYNACGCGSGATFLLVSLPILALAFLVKPAGLSLLSPLGLFVLLAVPIAAAISGKLVGLGYARRELKRAVNDLSLLLGARGS